MQTIGSADVAAVRATVTSEHVRRRAAAELVIATVAAELISTGPAVDHVVVGS